MTYSITEITSYDNKRNKVTLDYGEVAFLLYKGECRKHFPGEKTELTEEEYRQIREEILLPRARKRILYYLKNGDKTRHQIRQKLKEGLYPEDVAEEVLAFLDRWKFADDSRFAENYTAEQKGRRSRREIEQKLLQKGLERDEIRQQLEALEPEDEEAACRRALEKKYRGRPMPEEPGEKRKAFAYLARRGFGYEVIARVTGEIEETGETGELWEDS